MQHKDTLVEAFDEFMLDTLRRAFNGHKFDNEGWENLLYKLSGRIEKLNEYRQAHDELDVLFKCGSPPDCLPAMLQDLINTYEIKIAMLKQELKDK